MAKTNGHDQASPPSAREFFLRRILREAEEEGKPLTELEQWYLLTGPAKEAEEDRDKERIKQFASMHNESEFADRITNLLRRAMARDTAQNADAPVEYVAQLEALGNREEDIGFWMMCVPAIKPRFPQVLQWVFWIIAILVLVAGIWLLTR